MDPDIERKARQEDPTLHNEFFLGERASDDLITCAGILIMEAELVTPQDVVSFFEKPHKWQEELEELGYTVRVK